MSRVILGIDPGIAIVGYGLLEADSREVQRVLDVGVIRTEAGLPTAQRLLSVFQELEKLIQKYSPTQAAVEKLYFGKNVKTALTVGEARGVILLALESCGIPLVEFTPLEVKVALTGYGRADKQQMQHMVRQLLGLKEIPKPDDAADALAVALTAAVTYNSKE